MLVFTHRKIGRGEEILKECGTIFWVQIGSLRDEMLVLITTYDAHIQHIKKKNEKKNTAQLLLKTQRKVLCVHILRQCTVVVLFLCRNAQRKLKFQNKTFDFFFFSVSAVQKVARHSSSDTTFSIPSDRLWFFTLACFLVLIYATGLVWEGFPCRHNHGHRSSLSSFHLHTLTKTQHSSHWMFFSCFQRSKSTKSPQENTKQALKMWFLGSLCIASWNYFEFYSHMVAHLTNVY